MENFEVDFLAETGIDFFQQLLRLVLPDLLLVVESLEIGFGLVYLSAGVYLLEEVIQKHLIFFEHIIELLIELLKRSIFHFVERRE